MVRDRRSLALGALLFTAAIAAGCGGGGSSAIPPISNQGSGQVPTGSSPTPVPTTIGSAVPTLKPGATPTPTPLPSGQPTGGVTPTPRASTGPSSGPTTIPVSTPTPVITPPPTAKPTLPPTPTPTATPVPMQASAQILSRAYPNLGLPNVLPTFQPQVNQSGHGATIDGYTPAYDISYGFHRDVALAIFKDGQQLQLPMGIGMIQPLFKTCTAGPGIGNQYIIDDLEVYQIHNHDHAGIFHLEPHSTLETFKLGSLFDIWGNQPLGPTQVANQTGSVRVFTYNADANPIVATEVTGNPYNAIFSTQNHDVTVIEIGTFTPLPRYQFDPNYSNFQC
jgi:hypothetical protein